MTSIKKTYILNLKKRIDKFNFMKFKLKDIGIENYEFFHGVDGKNDTLCNELYTKFLDSTTENDYVTPNLLYISSPTVYAIIQSFIKLFEKIVNENNENDYVLILEDDVMFHKDFNIESLNKYNQDIVYLGANQLSWEGINCFNSYKLINNEKSITYGLYALRYKVSVLKNLLNEQLKDIQSLRKPMDYIIWKHIVDNNINNIVIFPNLVIPNLLGSDNMGDRNILKLARFKKWDLNKYKYFNLEMRYFNLYPILINDEPNYERKIVIDGISYYDLIKIARGEDL